MQARNLLISGGMAVLMAFSGAVHASTTLPWNIPGVVPQAGYPSFDFPTVNIYLQRTGANYQLNATYSSATPINSFQLAPGQTYDVYNPSFSLTALLNSSGALVGSSNTVTINGYVPNCGPGCTPSGNSSTLLFSANLMNYGSDTTPDVTPRAVGFTTDVTSFSGWATQFSLGASESVYLVNFPVDQFVNSFNSAGFFKNNWVGSSVTTVPLPAGVWLFGSALGVLAAARRKKSSSSA